MSVGAYNIEQRWFARSEPKPHAKLRLFCLPHAGSGPAIYRPWLAQMPPEIELRLIQLPGRETRLREQPFTHIGPLIEALAPAVEAELDKPYMLFGHSMGALVAFELARALRRRGAPAPLELLISGRRAPQLDDTDAPLHKLPEDAFIAAMVERYNGIPQIILDDLELLRLFLPTLRADLAVIETYEYAPEAPLDCSITAFGGSNDARARLADLQAWQAQSSWPVSIQQFPGGHFYLQDERDALIAAIVATALRNSL
jgi:medium-chain acyl-[acyl-carrier-protein] hydrolase